MDAKKPLISVIVPVYNVEKYLPKCLDSLLAQTWQELEIIVVDDGSPDNSWDIMQEYARRDSRVRPIRQKNGGLSAARNAGVEAARGEWIGFLDSDDYVAPEMYERLYRAAAEQGAQMAVCSFTYVTPDGKPIPRTSPITKNEVLSGIQVMERLAGPQNWYYITAWNRLYQKKLFDTVRFPVGKLHEDEYTAHLFYWQCERVAIVKRRCITTSSRTAASCTRSLSGGGWKALRECWSGQILRWNTRCAVSRSPPATAHWAASFCKGARRRSVRRSDR